MDIFSIGAFYKTTNKQLFYKKKVKILSQNVDRVLPKLSVDVKSVHGGFNFKLSLVHLDAMPIYML